MKIFNWFRKPDYIKCDNIVASFDVNKWTGLVGDSISFFDEILNQSIITIKLTKRNIHFILNPIKVDFFTNIKMYGLNKKERIYIYQKIEAQIVEQRTNSVIKFKKQLLDRIGLSEFEFLFLVRNCEDK